MFYYYFQIYGWTPVYYESMDLPADMPEDLVEHIKGLDANEVICDCFHNVNLPLIMQQCVGKVEIKSS